MMTKKSKVVKKVLAKKAAPKKAVAKKAVTKKAGVKKPTAKKASPKKAVAKKAVAKKAVVKNAIAKKPIAKKVAAKKVAVPKKIITKQASVKQVAKPPLPVQNKKETTKRVQRTKAKAMPAASLPATAELSEELVEKAANTNNSKPMMAPGEGTPPVTQDPVQAFDKNAFNKATAKGDPHSRLHLSSKPKNSIKPSGKKPLW